MRLTLLLILFLVFSCSERPKYAPERYLSADQQKLFKQEIARYAAKPPRRVTDTLRFDTAYADHYKREAAQLDLMAYYIDQASGMHYFLVARIAPSIQTKWVATGGKLRYDEKGNVSEYEEVFRTWKLPRKELEERSRYLFDLMVKGEDLTPYYTATAGFNYIEFPDENVYFDKKSRSWKSKIYGSVEEMVYESRDRDSLTKKPK